MAKILKIFLYRQECFLCALISRKIHSKLQLVFLWKIFIKEKNQRNQILVEYLLFKEVQTIQFIFFKVLMYLQRIRNLIQNMHYTMLNTYSNMSVPTLKLQKLLSSNLHCKATNFKNFGVCFLIKKSKSRKLLNYLDKSLNGI